MAKWITEAERMLIGGNLSKVKVDRGTNRLIPRPKKSLAESLQQTAVTWTRQLSPPSG
jgi:hypothetical protein